MIFGGKRRKKKLNVKIKRLRSNSVIPTKKSPMAAGYDLYAAIAKPVTIPPHKTMKIETGLAMELPPGYFAAIYARSGLATKHGLRPANCVGVCDEDYRGEYIVALYNDSNEEQIIVPGERIGQVIFRRYWNVEFEEVEELSDTERGANGFGSTGV